MSTFRQLSSERYGKRRLCHLRVVEEVGLFLTGQVTSSVVRCLSL